VEAALGRTIPGIWIQPQGGNIGPTAGFSFSILPIGYMGRIGGARLVPVGGTIYADVQANINSNYIVPEYVYKTETHKVSLHYDGIRALTITGGAYYIYATLKTRAFGETTSRRESKVETK
jgi:hypothetical protein